LLLTLYLLFLTDLQMNAFTKFLFLFRNVSLLKDFIESEFFLIDGDSLFITCMWNKTLKKGQNLHFFYIVEQFLHNFNQKDARYVIVFFKDIENIFFNHPKLLSLRTALIQHLEHNTQVPIHTEFSSCLSPEWEIFLKESYPYFLIVSDEGITSRQTDYLNIFILHALQKKINVVLASGQETNMLRIFGYQVQPLYSHWKFFEQVCFSFPFYMILISLCENCLFMPLALLSIGKLFYFFVHQTMSLLRNMWPEGADIKSIVCSLSCSVVLKTYKNMIDGVETSEEPREGKEETLTLEEAADLCRMLCLSVAFLQLLPLSQRAKSRIIHCNWKKKLSPFIRMLKRCEFFILKEIKTISQWKVDFTFLPDLTDNLLWKNIAYYYEVENCTGIYHFDCNEGRKTYFTSSPLELSLDFRITCRSSIFFLLFYIIVVIANINFVSQFFQVHKPEIPKLGLIPLTSQFVEDYVGDTLGDLPFLSNVDPSIISLSKRKEFDERKHWHSNRPLDDDYRNTNFNNNANSKDSKKQREVQKLYHFYHVFGESLNGRHRSMRIVNQVTAPLPTKTSQQKKIKSKNPKDINIAVQLMKRVHMILGKYPQFMKERHRKKLAKCLKYLGFDNLAESLYSEVKNLVTEDISKYSVHMGAARFQLSYMGHYLFREERSDPDPRVHHFIPDTWQRELLDVVDNNESAVIVAPTSSGKTYVSYYCMEKILKTSDEGVVVYVSPTKALINQVVGTVYSVFNKRRSKGGAICGVFTRDYRHDVMNSQILVTVPQCLEILLLSPHHQKWVKRIKYVIFDEVHCLGGEIGAEVWEHLLVMIRCPFLALSATISNPEYLTEWLASVKRYWQSFESMIDKSTSSKITLKGSKQNLSKTEKPSYRVRLVLYKERYNDLEKYVCSLKDDDFLISHYHPCAALTVNHIEKYGIPSDLGFSPRESIQLYDAMVQVWPEWPRDFEPEEFSCFKEKVVIMKTDSKKYEEELKKEIINWIHLDRDKVILHRIKYGRNASALKALAAQGIGYHHSSMQYKERQVVEMLFRLGYIKMSGRAGRRGEDLIGNVFFYDIPLPKVQRLLKSNVPQLRGQFPLSISLVLRLMILVMKADDKEDAKAKVLSVLQHSMMSFNQPKMKHMLKVYFIFSLQFLVREGYLDQECIPRGFSGLAIHLHYHEPSNFVFISFLEKGLFHKLCQPMKLKGPKVFSENVMETLVLVLANLFGRRYLPSCVKRYKRTFSQSKVILNDLPKEFAAAAEEYNHKIENDFGSFLLIISELADMKKEYQLPLSEIDFSGEECRDSELVSHLMPGMENRTAVSPFACLSEITDQDLFNIDMIVLRTIDVHDKNAPYFWLKKFDRDGSRHHLNAYAFDFYKHGSMAALALDNGLNKGDAFAAIKDFGLLIQAIRISLAELCDDEQDDVVLAFGQLSDAYCKKIWGKEKEQSHRS
uniref:Helicase ATP-binding domain-containing protein n=1 Tax=Monodelphis domestica TaxID=13616 RepID=A0A5F8GWE2_MONDO